MSMPQCRDVAAKDLNGAGMGRLGMAKDKIAKRVCTMKEQCKEYIVIEVSK